LVVVLVVVLELARLAAPVAVALVVFMLLVI
jgi:hypothetical protein